MLCFASVCTPFVKKKTASLKLQSITCLYQIATFSFLTSVSNMNNTDVSMPLAILSAQRTCHA